MSPPLPRGAAARGPHRITQRDLAQYAGRTLPDLVPQDCRLLLVGINPGLWSAATGAHFARPGNRFYPALAAAGITPYVVDARDGYRAQDRAMLLERGLGITNLVARASARADELNTEELREAQRTLPQRVLRIRPRVVAVLGLTSYRTAFGRPRATAGRQPETVADRPLWVLPNPSGLNAHETVATLAAAYAEPARAAGIELAPNTQKGDALR